MLQRASGPGFFQRVRSHLADKYSGRLMALALRELGEHEPDSFLRILGGLSDAGATIPGKAIKAIEKGSAQFVCEWPFRGTGGNRRAADLAVLVGGEPVLLIEVKEDDVASDGNVAQVEDYLAFIGSRIGGDDSPTAFVHLSRYVPLPSVLDAISRARRDGLSAHEVRYRNLHGALVGVGQPLARMLVQYLEDNGVDAYRVIDLDKDRAALALLLIQVLGFNQHHGLGKLYSEASIAAVPDLMAVLLGNVAVFGDWLQEGNRDVIGRRPTRGFKPEYRYPVTKLKQAVKTLEPDEDGTASLEKAPWLIQSGTVWFYTQARLRSPKGAKKVLEPGQWLYVDIGYGLSIERNDKEGLGRLWLYSAIHWPGNGDTNCYYDTDYLDPFPSEPVAKRYLRDRLRHSINAAKKVTEAPYREVLEHFEPPVVR